MFKIMMKIDTSKELINQLFTSIEDRNVDRFHIALVIALAQQPLIDLNQIHQNGHTLLTFAVIHYNPLIISQLLNEVSINVHQPNAFNRTLIQIAAEKCNFDDVFTNEIDTFTAPSVTDEQSQRPTATTKRQQQPLTMSGKLFSKNTGRLKCPDCPYTTNRAGNYANHQLTHTGERRFSCSKCDYTASRSHHLKEHSRIHSDEHSFECSECPYTCKNKKNMSDHARFHTGDRPHKCSLCSANYNVAAALERHKFSHSGERPFKCRLCDSAYVGKADLVRHEREVHGVETAKMAKFQCTWSGCSYSTFEKRDFGRHERTHTGERPFKCDECDLKFKEKGTLRKHKLTHSGERPFKCRHCSYAASQSNSVLQHEVRQHGQDHDKVRIALRLKERSGQLQTRKQDLNDYGNTSPVERGEIVDQDPHKPSINQTVDICTVSGETFETNDKNQPEVSVFEFDNTLKHKCSFCPYITESRGNFVTHERTHTGERPFKCTECDKAFSQKTALTKHIRTHTNERPYKCSLCDFAGKQPTTLKQHVVAVHGIAGAQKEKFQCAHCPFTTYHKGSYTNHMRIHTGERPYKCRHCDEAFTHTGSRAIHERRHTGEKPFKCSICDHSATIKQAIQSHERDIHGLHTDVKKKYDCPDCKYKTHHSSSFKAHRRIHTGERPYKCINCTASFTQTGALKKHRQQKHKEPKS